MIHKWESTGAKSFNDFKAFTKYSNDIEDIYENIEELNQNKKKKTLCVFDDMIADMLSSEKLNSVVTESYFAVPKNIRLNSRHFFVMKIPNKRELEQNAFNHSSDIYFQDFINLSKKFTGKPNSFLVIGTTLASDNPLRFRKNILERNKR